jgi:hypothetical protein
MHDDVEVRAYRPGDEQPILDTFNAVFRIECGPGFVDRTLAFWNWQFLGNPEGHRITLAVARDGTVAAQFAGVPLLADTPLGPQRFVHVVDSMAHPAFRAGGAPFLRAARSFHGECEARAEALCFGYPVQAAQAIGERFLGYEPLRRIDYLVRGQVMPPTFPDDHAVVRVEAMPADVDGLWAAVRAPHACAIRRDLRYLRWRYDEHPEPRRYECWSVRVGERLAGLAVLALRQELVPSAVAIAEWLVGDDEPLVAQALLAAAVRRQRELGRQRLFTMLAPWSNACRLLLAHGFERIPSERWLGRELVVHRHLETLTREQLMVGFWNTLGDSDLV